MGSGIKQPAPFNALGEWFNNLRDGFETMAEMRAVREQDFPDVFVASCQEKEYKGVYYYDKDAEFDAVYGKWKKINSAGPKTLQYLYKVADMLYTAGFETLDYEYAYKYFETNYHKPPTLAMGRPISRSCSAVRKDNLLGFNLDWTYNDACNIVVRTTHTSTRYWSGGVVGGSDKLNTTLLDSGALDKEEFKLLPFLLNSGCNENGVFAKLNVVPLGDKGHTTGTNPTSDISICGFMLVRYIIDNYKSIDDFITDLPNLNIYMPYGDDVKEELHYMIGDKNKTYILEFIDNAPKVIDITETSHQFMTNYYEDGATYDINNHIVYSSVTDYGSGLERAKIIADKYNDIDSVKSMMYLMEKDLKFTKLYNKGTNPYWYSEFVGNWTDTKYAVDLKVSTINDDPTKFNEIIDDQIEKYEHRSRDKEDPNYGTWYTAHSVVFDIKNKCLYISVDEKEKEYHLAFDFIDEFVKRFQGFANAGKILGIDDDGMVKPVNMPSLKDVDIEITNPMPINDEINIYREKGSTYTDFDIEATITPHSTKITKYKICVNENIIKEEEVEEEDSFDVSATCTLNITEDSTIKVIVLDKDTQYELDLDIKFVYKKYCGVVDNDTELTDITQAMIKAFTTTGLNDRKEMFYKNIDTGGTLKKVVYAYPSNLGDIEKITNESQLVMTACYDKTMIDIVNDYGEKTSYNVYLKGEGIKTSIDNAVLQHYE